ncbi:MAG: hypothetical protein F9K13_06515 [Candidatus Methylomirabilis oxygeniifera]|uniref:DUF5667 domain-containing protein n=1 Tax=Methylomirabilis oxygeniifera TaxID=671143 RepID=D5MHH3_METO1|nr:MAG: hypothetical protein F9K13_06515 [Candidatus Methylomirabilis oxyfera]CBE69205.1 conserved exported protein of unknown function [Candidatus Methylomirabilis oxyfera]
MKKLLTLALALVTLAVFPSLGVAQEERRIGMPPVDAKKDIAEVSAASPTFKAIHDPLEGKLKAIEGVLSGVERRKIVVEADVELGKQMYEYAEAMKAAFDQAMKDAEEAAKSQGKKGSVGSLRVFEDTAKAHEKRVKGIETQTKSIESALKKGTIKLDKPVLLKMEPAEREEFRKFLEPPVSKELEKTHPDIFHHPRRGTSLDLSGVTQVAENIQGFCSSLPEEVSNFLVTPAEASIAIPCIAPCANAFSNKKNPNWAACWSCIASQGQQAIVAWNSFVSGWNACGQCKKVVTWPCKALRLAIFIAKLA